MERIVSRSSTEKILRTGVTTVLVCGYSMWSLWDGFVRYPRENVAAAWQAKLGLPTRAVLPRPDERISRSAIDGVRVGDRVDALPPWFQRPDFENEGSKVFFGDAGYVVVRVADGKVAESTWADGPRHTATDLAFQKLVGFVLAPIGFALLVYFVRVCTFRVVLDERGLRIGGRRSIAYGSMTALREVGPPGRGLHELLWRTRGKSRRFRFDRYSVAHAESLCHALGERMGTAGSVPPIEGA